MCGRFTIAIEPAELMEEFDLPEVPTNWIKRYNVAPSQMIPVIPDIIEKRIEYLKWGLIPRWSKDPAIGNKLINARAETILEKPSFRDAFVNRRCLIIANGFYEWKRDPAGKKPSQPFRFVRTNRKPFAFAGIWEIWRSNEQEIKTAAIITCNANLVVQSIHDRMPVIIPKDLYERWLFETSSQNLQKMLLPFAADQLMSYPVSTLINKPDYDAPDCIVQN